MSKKDKEKKGFWGEFKEFVTRGNVLDMAVGVIVGGAFTAIVNALSNNVLKPVINWILALMIGADGLDNVYTFLKKVPVDPADPSAGVDLTTSIYIDWGAFINAIINFLLIALVLFCIVKLINKLHAVQQDMKEAAQKRLEEKAVAANAGSETPVEISESVEGGAAEASEKDGKKE